MNYLLYPTEKSFKTEWIWAVTS